MENDTSNKWRVLRRACGKVQTTKPVKTIDSSFCRRRTAVCRALSPLAGTGCGAAGGLRVLLRLHQRGLKTAEGASRGSACGFGGGGQGSTAGHARLSGRAGVGDRVLHGEHKKPRRRPDHARELPGRAGRERRRFADRNRSAPLPGATGADAGAIVQGSGYAARCATEPAALYHADSLRQHCTAAGGHAAVIGGPARRPGAH